MFERVDNLFAEAERNATLANRLKQDKIVLFLHLLGIDTYGHSKRPFSREYLHEIAVIDEGIRRVEQRIETFFNHDGQTAYVFTADHGMSDKGSYYYHYCSVYCLFDLIN